MSDSFLTRGKVIDRVKFDASNPAHREVLHTFLEKGRWDKHFIAEPAVTNLPYKLMLDTLNWYRSNEKTS